MSKLPNARDLVLNKETKFSNGVYGCQAEKEHHLRYTLRFIKGIWIDDKRNGY